MVLYFLILCMFLISFNFPDRYDLYFMDFFTSILYLSTSEMNKGVKNYFVQTGVYVEELDPQLSTFI